jgi:hypothetical protein
MDMVIVKRAEFILERILCPLVKLVKGIFPFDLILYYADSVKNKQVHQDRVIPMNLFLFNCRSIYL